VPAAVAGEYGAEGGDSASQTQTLRYAPTQLSPTLQHTQPHQQHYDDELLSEVAAGRIGGFDSGRSGSAFVGHAQDVGTQDLDNGAQDAEKEEKKDADTAYDVLYFYRIKRRLRWTDMMIIESDNSLVVVDLSIINI
jgi:hypothetical protein